VYIYTLNVKETTSKFLVLITVLLAQMLLSYMELLVLILVHVDIGPTITVTPVTLVITLVNAAVVVITTNVLNVTLITIYITDIVFLPAQMELIQMITPVTVNSVTVLA